MSRQRALRVSFASLQALSQSTPADSGDTTVTRYLGKTRPGLEYAKGMNVYHCNIIERAFVQLIGSTHLTLGVHAP